MNSIVFGKIKGRDQKSTTCSEDISPEEKNDILRQYNNKIIMQSNSLRYHLIISDSMRATGMPDGQYTLGGLDVKVTGNRATLVSDGALAGSVTNLADCMRTAVTQMGIPLETAVACATKNPAISLGIYEERGSISVGKKADILLLDQNLTLKKVIKSGR